MSVPTKDCYQVKVHATMTSELKCLYEKLGTDMFKVNVLTKFADDIFLNNSEGVPAPKLYPEILEVEFDKCDPCKVTFTVYVELPKGILNNPTVDICPDDGEYDMQTLAVEHRLSTKGHIHPLEMSIFMVYPLAENDKTNSGAVASSGYEEECYSYEQCRVPCQDESVCGYLQKPESFRVVFPLKQAVACMIPEFGLSGFYMKNLVSTNLKTKVRLVSVNNPEANTAAGLLTYDPKKCEACLEVCTGDADNYDCIVKGWEHLFNGDAQPSLDQMATNRTYAVRGISKCTEKDLFVFELCYKPPLVPVEGDNSGYMNYGIISVSSDHWCYEFKNKVADLSPP